MAEQLTGKTIWNEASKAGLALGGLCIAYMVINNLLALIPGGTIIIFLKSVVTFLLWAGKLFGCIYLMRFFMLKLTIDFPEAINKDTYKLGVASAFLSALIVAAANMAYTMFFAAEELQEALTQSLSTIPLDSNSTAMMESMMQNLPTITFFSQLIYCFLFGWVLSAILSSNIPSKNPFNN